MSLEYKFESLEGGFPRDLTPAHRRGGSQFGKTWTQVQEILERELRFLKYRRGSVVLQTAHSPWDVRKDGQLRSDVRKPEHPGVVLKFDVYDSNQKKYVQMSFECDQFTEWKANVRAIADALEALRKIDRYGVSGGGRADAHYEGYKALPAADGTAGEAADSVLAQFIAEHSGEPVRDILSSREAFYRACKKASARLHPDNRETGDHNGFVHLQKVKTILETSLFAGK